MSGAFRLPEQLLPETAPEDLRRLVAYWIALADGRTMPEFADLDPIEVPWALSRLFVLHGRRVVMPLGPADGPVDHLIGMAAFETLARSRITDPGVIDVHWVALRPATDAGPGPVIGSGV